jgi:SAM-dependent methyltransferase
MATRILRTGAAPVSSLVEEIAYRISLRRKVRLTAEQEAGTFSVEAYADWRRDSLISSFNRNFSAAEVAGKRVLDFGCGFGNLSRLATSLGARQVIGVDIDPKSIERASSEPTPNVTFQLEPDPSRISLPDTSIDVVLVFAVLEHIMEYEAIAGEWARILAPGGKVLIVWSMQWRHPYGHHLYTIIPLPWIHLLLDPAAVARIARRIYDSPDYQPQWWHLDPNSARKPNPFRAMYSNLNKLSTSRFESVARRAGFSIPRKEAQSGSNRLRQLLARIPGLQDFLCAQFVYELQKPLS